MPTLEAKKIFYSGLYADYLSIPEKDDDLLYFCTDVKKVFKGEIEMTEQVKFDFYRPVSPITGKMYVFSASGTAEIYDGTTWNVIAYPICGTNDVITRTLSAGNTSVTFDAPTNDEVVDFFTDNGAQYTSVDTSVEGKITVGYAAQQVNDQVHMRTYDNEHYMTRLISSLCLDNLQITQQPNITLFAVGDPIDVTGIQVTGTLGNNQYDLTQYIETMPPMGSKIENEINSIRVIFGAQEVSLPVNTIPAFDELVITSMPTKTVYKVAEHLDLTGLVVTAYAASRTYSKDVTSICRIRPKNDAVLNKNNTTYTINVTYENMHTSFNVETRGPENLEAASWSEIQYALKDGSISNFARVGNTKSFTYNGNTYHAQLASINDGTGTAGQYYPAGTADFIAVEVMPDVKDFGTQNYWSISSTRSFLNETVYTGLPEDLKNVIVNKERWYNCYGGGYDHNSREFDSDKLWLPSIYEMSACNERTGSGRNWSIENSTYCKHYEIFSSQADADPSRVKSIIGQSAATDYAILPFSRINNYSTSINRITTDGAIGEDSGFTIRCYVVICFRIG